MSTARIIADADFEKLLAVPELLADPLFNRAVASYGRMRRGNKHCCGSTSSISGIEHITLAGAALRRYAGRDPKGLTTILRRSFNIPADQPIMLGLGAPPTALS
jgi:hypothetical protein